MVQGYGGRRQLSLLVLVQLVSLTLLRSAQPTGSQAFDPSKVLFIQADTRPLLEGHFQADAGQRLFALDPRHSALPFSLPPVGNATGRDTGCPRPDDWRAPSHDRHRYTLDPAGHPYRPGVVAVNRMVAEGLGYAYHHVQWRLVDPARRPPWAKVDLALSLFAAAGHEAPSGAPEWQAHNPFGRAAESGGPAAAGNGSAAGADAAAASHVRQLVRDMLAGGGWQVLIVMDTDAYVRDPVAFDAQVRAFAANSSALLAYAEEPNCVGAWNKAHVQYFNTGLQLLKNDRRVYDYYARVWALPDRDPAYARYKEQWPWEQVVHNAVLLRDDTLWPRAVLLLPLLAYNTPVGSVVRHVWFKGLVWEALGQDLVGVALWRHALLPARRAAGTEGSGHGARR